MSDERALGPEEPSGAPEPATAAAPSSLGDGEWHRLHPATPILRGGLVLLAILGYVITNLRERAIEMFLPDYSEGEDPLDLLLDSGFLLQALAIIAGLLLVLVGGFYLSWRLHQFRITEEVVEVRSGIVFRTNRKARLDRIQGINITRPFFARLFGAARLEVSQAGSDANVQLSYLASGAADELRREILRRASGSRARDAAAAASADGRGLLDRRVGELLAPELDPDTAPPESVVKLTTGRLIGSTALTLAESVVWIGIALGLVVAFTRQPIILVFSLIPALLGLGGYAVSRIMRSLRYSIAGTPDGVRVGFGLLSTSNETLPPGRIHSVKISQPLLWRPFGWWEVKVNRASKSSTSGAANQANTTLLPVGSRADVLRVLELLIPAFADDAGRAMALAGLASAGDDDGFTNSPRRAAVLRWFSWRRNGFHIADAAVLLRKGRIWRELVIVPQPRVQSVAMHQGPILRRLRLASLRLHTVAGPITASLGAVDSREAERFFAIVAETAVRSAGSDLSHRWGSTA